ncbi:hypothetical protein GCM10008014_09070 [Paenibacillus silvae]|uniref:DUF3892 domain-containing protein n=1 Tax=Paenibacillus silvae TaxID=1325358 RepID=A0ABQ1Z181_9BACL|nr:hypothetical protein [Paenibacillus silvae]GGH46411.1 hypothetical protein GCM10008014_09070 [Paenibacillus silvae]
MMTVMIKMNTGKVIARGEVFDDEWKGQDSKDMISRILNRSNQQIIVLNHESEYNEIINTDDIESWEFRGNAY